MTGLIEIGTNLFEDVDSKKAASSAGIMGILACCEEILHRSLSRQTSVLGFLHLRRLVHLRLYLWTSEMMIYTAGLQFKRTCLLLKLSMICQI